MRSSLRRAAAGEGAEAMCSSATSAINTLERVLRHQGRSASSQRQRKSSRWQQRAHVCAVFRRFDNTSLNGYQPLVVIPLVSTRMSAACMLIYLFAGWGASGMGETFRGPYTIAPTVPGTGDAGGREGCLFTWAIRSRVRKPTGAPTCCLGDRARIFRIAKRRKGSHAPSARARGHPG